jgi:hypothetical protein
MKLIPPPEGESEVLQRWLDLCQGYVVTVRLKDHGKRRDVILWNFCETDDDGYLVINAADWDETDPANDRINRRQIRTIDISTLEVY